MNAVDMFTFICQFHFQTQFMLNLLNKLLIERGVHNCLFQPLKRKSAAANYGQGIADRNPVSGYANVNSPMQTAISGKDAQKVPRTLKARSASQAVTSNVGEDFQLKMFHTKR